ncbi:MAG: hypothetical protein Q7I99_01600 [Acholeplasmataceae bacterium]|nr:hypothetical protein [Acholeplasmataceae bacterium]
MTYVIMIWMITILLTIWLLSRVNQTNKYLERFHEMSIEKNNIHDFIKNRLCVATIVIIVMWWISFILLESYKLNYIHYTTQYNYQIIAFIFLSPVIFYIQWKRKKSIKEKYNACMINCDLRMEFAIALLTSIIYAQILSFAIESTMTYLA